LNIYEIITKKKHGLALTQDEINFFIDGYMKGYVADYQASALLMAICIKGMDKDETFYLTKAMLDSGDAVDLSCFSTLSVDKHSTGGVGDKTTLIVAPIVACLGGKVAKMSGRGLGFTDGTVDKLEGITGYHAQLEPEQFLEQVEKIGVCVVGQSGNLAPADKKLYALRDITATIDSIPLIASSIMSKKLASGSHNIVLDVKCGSGAFMKTSKEAISLAMAMIEIGKSFGRNVRALVTNMDIPLGYGVGNRTEVWEAIQVLSGKGEKRLTEICISLATNMIALSLNIDTGLANSMVLDAISSGKALLKLREWISVQGGDASFIDKPEMLLNSTYQAEYIAKSDGYISKMTADKIGYASMQLGAGRKKLGDTIDYTAGIIFNKSFGDFVKKGEAIATMYSSSSSFDECILTLDSAIFITKDKPNKEALIFDTIE
jgi:pyrimidine-nucleoside phosphorylase